MPDLLDGKPAAGPYPESTEQPREKPILFSGEMVRAILEGRKTQTRRVIQLQEKWPADIGAQYIGDPKAEWHFANDDFWQAFRNCPYGKPGDRLWVRESWRRSEGASSQIFYRTDHSEYEQREKGPWKPSIHMPRWASRITLDITAVSIQRIQDISSSDAFAEGIVQTRSDIPKDPQIEFQKLWDSINGKRGFGWESNPWVWVIEFRRDTGSK